MWRQLRAIGLLPGVSAGVVPFAILALTGTGVGWGLDGPLRVLPILGGIAPPQALQDVHDPADKDDKHNRAGEEANHQPGVPEHGEEAGYGGSAGWGRGPIVMRLHRLSEVAGSTPDWRARA